MFDSFDPGLNMSSKVLGLDPLIGFRHVCFFLRVDGWGVVREKQSVFFYHKLARVEVFKPFRPSPVRFYAKMFPNFVFATITFVKIRNAYGKCDFICRHHLKMLLQASFHCIAHEASSRLEYKKSFTI